MLATVSMLTSLQSCKLQTSTVGASIHQLWRHKASILSIPVEILDYSVEEPIPQLKHSISALLSPIYRSVLSNYCCPDSVLERRAPAYSVDAPITITSSDLSEDDLLSSYSGSFLSSFPDLLCIVRSRTASTSPSSTRSWVHRNVGDRR